MVYPIAWFVLVSVIFLYLLCIIGIHVKRGWLLSILVLHVFVRGVVDISLIIRFNPFALGYIDLLSSLALSGGIASLVAIFYQILFVKKTD